jgi:hypothetical protein
MMGVAMSRAGGLLSGLLVGAAIGGGLAMLLSPRAGVVVPAGGEAGTDLAGPTPFEPINGLVERVRLFVDDVRSQVQQAIAEGRATAELTRKELTAQFEAAKKASTTDRKPR